MVYDWAEDAVHPFVGEREEGDGWGENPNTGGVLTRNPCLSGAEHARIDYTQQNILHY